MKLRVLLSAFLFINFLAPSSMAVENNSVATRSSIDRPDDLSGYQIRLIYVVPADVKDRNLDTNGTISKWIEEVKKVSKVQTGLTPRFDTYQNNFDIGYLKSQYTIAQLVGAPKSLEALGLLQKELPLSEQDDLKGVGFIVDGKIVSTGYCGYANMPGKYFSAWLGTDCWEDTEAYNNRDYITWIARAILHEWFHNLGVDHTCVTDELMWGGGCEAIDQGDKNSIDEKRAYYLGASKSGVDISLLPVWEENIKSGPIVKDFQKVTKSNNPWRSSEGLVGIWGTFELSKDWASSSEVSWKCDVVTSTGLILESSLKNSMCEAKAKSNLKIGTRIYMSVVAEGLWQRSSSVVVFEVLGQEGESKYCESNSCVVGETVRVDIDLCFATGGYVKLQLLQNGIWIDLKKDKMVKDVTRCKTSYPYTAFTNLKGLSIGINKFRWIRADDKGFKKTLSTYKEFEIEIQPEAVK